MNLGSTTTSHEPERSIHNTIRIVIADRFPIIRYGVRSWAEKHENFEVVGEARNYQELERVIIRTTPEILLLDLNLLGEDPVNRWRELRAQVVGLRLISFGTSSEAEVQQAAACGAAAHLLKNEDLTKLPGLLTSVYMGNSYLSRTHPPESTHPAATKEEIGTRLTEREVEVLRLIVAGRTSTEVSELLNIRPRTVNAHRANISKKLNIHRLADLVSYAIRTGLTISD